MISEAINRILQLSPSQKRDPVIEIEDDSQRRYIYNDAQLRYEPIERAVTQGGSVSNIESFVDLVLEEGRRRLFTDELLDGIDTHDGLFMTVVFSETGAKFSPDDRVQLDDFTYSRALSPQWLTLAGVLGKPLEHKQLVAAIQSLRPSIVGYPEIIRQFKKISFGEKTNIISEPTLSAGANQNIYDVQVSVSGGAAGAADARVTALPSEFPIELQYAYGSQKRYRTDIEIDLTTVQKGDRKELRFTLIAPDLPNVREQAIEDEIAYFKAKTEAMNRLLVLLDF